MVSNEELSFLVKNAYSVVASADGSKYMEWIAVKILH